MIIDLISTMLGDKSSCILWCIESLSGSPSVYLGTDRFQGRVSPTIFSIVECELNPNLDKTVGEVGKASSFIRKGEENRTTHEQFSPIISL